MITFRSVGAWGRVWNYIFSPNAINFREPIMDQNVAMYKIHLELAVCQQCVYLYDGEEVNR